MALTRGVPPALLMVLSGHFHPVLMTEADWPTGVVNIHTGVGPISWDSKTWPGLGNLVQFRAPEEAGGIATAAATVRVAMTAEDMLAERATVIRNRQITVWFGATTKPAGNVLASDPVLLFTGYFDSRTGSLTRSNSELAHDMILGLGIGPSARASASITHSYEDQITKFPGDTAGRQVQNAIKRQMNPPTWPAP